MTAGLVGALLPCAATAATSPVKPSVSGTAPAATAPGRTLKVATTLKSSKTRTIRVGLVLANGTRATGGLALGAGKKLRLPAGRRVRLAVSGKIAAGTLDNGVRRLLVCVDPAKAVRGTAPAGSCAAVKGAVGATALPDPVGLIDAALQARRISAAQSRTYRLWAVVNSSKLPKVYRGKTVESTHAVVSDLANNAGKLSAAARAEAVRYFLPPTATGNAWIGKPGARALAEDPLACKGFGQLQSIADGGFDDEYQRRWDAIVSPDNRALVWYLKWTAKPPANASRTREAAENTATGRTSAIKYALAFPKIWNTLTAQFGEPKSDASEHCYHGPDGRYDIYVDVDYGGISASGPAGAIAVTLPYPAQGNFPVPGKWCTDRPAFTVIYPGLDNFVLAHEFMHAIQFAHHYKTCDEPVAFWDEGGANFAADMVYPDNQYEQRTAKYLLTNPTWFSSPRSADYQYWPFWMMLQRENGAGVLRNVFSQLASKQAIDAVDAAIPGGFAKQIPRLGLTIWNQTPIGAPGFPVTKAFQQWDRWTGRPDAQRVTVNLGAQPQGLYSLHVFSGQSDTTIDPISIAAYHDVTIRDATVKELKFSNALAGRPTHVDAMLHTVGGQWRLEDWTAKREVVLCRDNPAENVDRIILVSSNVSKTATLPQVFHRLEARKTCGYPKRFTGSFHTVFTVAAPGITQTYTYDGSVTLVRSTTRNFSTQDIGVTWYDVVGGTISWAFQQDNVNCTYGTSGTTPISPLLSSGLVLEDTRLRAPPLGGPRPWRYAVQIGELQQFDLVCPGGTTTPYLLQDGVTVGPGLTTDDSAETSASPTLLSGTSHQTVTFPMTSASQTLDQSWTFNGFPE